jgi:hypothetical protein
VRRTCPPRFDAAQHDSRGTLRPEFFASFLKDEKAMDTAGTATRRDPDKPRDHLDVFREFIDHLERNARSANAAAQDKRRRASSR